MSEVVETDAELIEELKQASELPTIGRVCRRFANEAGFEHFLYGYRSPLPLSKPCQFILNGYPRAWREHYDRSGFMLIDPVLQRAVSSVLPFYWSELERRSEAVETIFRAAASYGLVHGVSAPVHGPRGDGGLLSLARAAPLPAVLAERLALERRLLWFSAQIHETLRRVVFESARASDPAPMLSRPLSAREKECLRYVAEGLIDRQIAAALSVSERTVRFHMDRAFEKLGAKNRSEAIARAVSFGLVSSALYNPQLAQSQTFVDLTAKH